MSDYYHQHAEAYHEATFHIDPASFLRPLTDRLPPGVLILDVGCGSGRDLRWLRHRGFRAVGLERSPGLARLARENAGCPVLEADFTAFDFASLSVDGMLLVGAFVHVPHGEFPALLSRCTAALEPGGLVLITLKEGDGQATDARGRSTTGRNTQPQRPAAFPVRHRCNSIRIWPQTMRLRNAGKKLGRGSVA